MQQIVCRFPLFQHYFVNDLSELENVHSVFINTHSMIQFPKSFIFSRL